MFEISVLASDENCKLAFDMVDHAYSCLSEKYAAIGLRAAGVNDEYDLMDADACIVFYDKYILNDQYKLLFLESIERMKINRRGPVISCVVLDNSPLPNGIRKENCILCDDTSSKSIKQTEYRIQRMLEEILRKKLGLSMGKSIDPQRKWAMLGLTLSMDLLAAFLIAVAFQAQSFSSDFEFALVIVALTTVMTSVLFTMLNFMSLIKTQHREDSYVDMKNYSTRLEKTIVPNKSTVQNVSEDIPELEERQSELPKEIGALERMLVNLEDIKEYYTWSQRQAKTAFTWAIIICISGILLMAAAVVLPVVFHLSFEMSLIPAIGGVITELVAGTALVVYRHSLTQLNHYHKALHEDERFLSSVNLLGKFSTSEIRDKMLEQIIQSEIQMNMIETDKNYAEKKTTDS